MEKITFPEGFTWGAACASYQVEGAVKEDGRGETIWDRYSHIRDGRIYNLEDGDTACDFYHRYPEDIAVMKELNIQSLRYSIAWSRIFPEGKGEVNQKGLDFYRRLTETLLENGIKPCATLYHWDLPQALQDLGGWCNRDMAGYYGEYAETMFRALGDLVPEWITINETYIHTRNGYYLGLHAPGLRDFSASLLAGHNLMRAHGEGVKRYRALGLGGKIGISNNYGTPYPLTGSEMDRAAAVRQDGWRRRWFTDPLFGKGYPQDMMEWYENQGVTLPKLHSGDLELMAGPMDFLGVNYYHPDYMYHDPKSWPNQASPKLTGLPYTECGWEIEPRGLYDLLVTLDRDYGHPEIKITENGSAWRDYLNREGKIADDNRIDYLYKHLLACRRAIDDGVQLNAYYAWSLTDNIEWSEATSLRFGLVYLDYATQKRTIKESGRWYGNLIKTNGFDQV